MDASSFDELEALGQIVITIKAYRSETNDYGYAFTNVRLNDYLEEQLSAADWLLWQSIWGEEQKKIHGQDKPWLLKRLQMMPKRYKKQTNRSSQSERERY